MAAPVNRWFILVLVCVAQFMVVLDATIVNVALPSIQSGLHFSQLNLQWIVNIYTLFFGGFLLLGGRASDLLGRQRLFLAGLALFTLASLVNGVATSGGMLIAGRAVQGLGAALVSPAALSIVTTTFAEGKERTRALGIWSAIAAGGGAVGLLLGGLLTDTLSWRWVFFINLPIGIVAFVLGLRYIENTRAAQRPDTADVFGAVTVTGGLLALVYDIVQAQTWGWTSAKTLGLFVVAVALLVTFVFVERRSKAPLIRLDIFRVRSLASANTAMLFVMSGLFAMFYFASIYVQEILGWSPLKAGAAFLPVTAGIVVGAGLAQTLVRQLGVRVVPVIGIAMAATGLVLLSRIPTHGTYLADLLPGLSIMSVGMGLTFVPITLIATTGLADEDAGLASGLFNTSQQVGGALGLAVLSSLAATRTRHTLGVSHATALVHGFQLAFLTGAGLMAAAIVVIVVTLRRHHVAAVTAEQPVLVGA